MFKKLLLTFFVFTGIGYCDTGFKDTIQFSETDGSPQCMVGRVVVSTGTLTCNGQVATIITGGGGGGGGGSSSSTSTLSGFYLRDSSNVKWLVVVNSSGAYTTSIVSSVPSGVIYRTSIVRQDASFGLWIMTINTSGVLLTTSGGSTGATIQDILINDSSNYTWVTSVGTSGVLTTL